MATINFLAIFGALTTLIGLMLVTWSLKIHQTGTIPQRYIILLVFFGISLSQIITGSEVVLVDGQWLILRGTLVRILMFGGTGWITFELLRVFLTGASKVDSVWSKLSLAYPIGIIMSFIMLTLRENLPFAFTAYQIPTAIGSLILVIAIIKDPALLITAKTELSLVVLADRLSGMAILSYPDEELNKAKTSLTAAAITGISNIIKEISGKKDLPPNLGYADYIIGIYPSATLMLYSISTGQHPLMEALLKNLADTLDNRISLKNGRIIKEERKLFQNKVETSLDIFMTKTTLNKN